VLCVLARMISHIFAASGAYLGVLCTPCVVFVSLYCVVCVCSCVSCVHGKGALITNSFVIFLTFYL
jgi:hypothetical protein